MRNQLMPFAKYRDDVRRLLRWTWIYFLHFTGLLRWAEYKTVTSSGVVVLTLHRVLPRAAFKNTPSLKGMIVSLETFEQLGAFLKKHYDVLDLCNDQPDWCGGTRPRLAITFDDGWKDTAEIAFPLLHKYSIPATVFVCPGLAGKSFPFWPERVSHMWKVTEKDVGLRHGFVAICNEFLLHRTFWPAKDKRNVVEQLIGCIKELPKERRDLLVYKLSSLMSEDFSDSKGLAFEATMSSDETKAIERMGAQIGSHTLHHEILTQLPSDQAHSEIGESKEVIESWLGHPCRTFAYPNGNWSLGIRALIVRVGFTRAFINSPGIWTRDTDSLLIPRVNIWEGSLTNASNNFSPIVFQYSTFWKAYRAERKRRRIVGSQATT